MLKKAVTQIILIFWAFISIFPLYWMFTFSLKSNDEIFGGNVAGLPIEYRFDNYEKILKETDLLKNLGNTFVVTILTVVFTVLLSSMAAYALTRFRWKLRNAVYLLFLTGIMLPIHAVLLPLYRNIKPILNTYWSLVLPYVAFQMPLTILIMTGALESLPVEIEEAALVDGANVYQIYLTIVLPLLRPFSITAAILAWLASWNEFMLSVTFITDSVHKTITGGILTLIGRYTTNWGQVGAGLSISALPVLVIYTVLAKNIQKSLVIGAVKG